MNWLRRSVLHFWLNFTRLGLVCKLQRYKHQANWRKVASELLAHFDKFTKQIPANGIATVAYNKTNACPPTLLGENEP